MILFPLKFIEDQLRAMHVLVSKKCKQVKCRTTQVAILLLYQPNNGTGWANIAQHTIWSVLLPRRGSARCSSYVSNLYVDLINFENFIYFRLGRSSDAVRWIRTLLCPTKLCQLIKTIMQILVLILILQYEFPPNSENASLQVLFN